METMPSTADLQDKLFDKLAKTGWDRKLRYFVRSSDMIDLLMLLQQERAANKRFTPSLNDVFKCFQACHFEQLKVVFVAPEPHQNPLLNNGLAISHNGNLTEQYAFKSFYEELQRTVGQNSLMNAELLKWSYQGILLLNTSLTTRIGYVGSHFKIWQPFLNSVFDVLNREENLIWVFFGENPYFDSIDNESHFKFQVPALPTERDKIWQTDIFKKINESLVLVNKEKIIW